MERTLAQVNIQKSFPPAENFDTIGSLVSVVAQNAFVFAGVIAFVILIFGGFAIIMGAGAGDTKQLEQGKKAMTGAAIGLIIIIGSFWIIQILETLTGMSLLPTK
jgi:hypothetical protein